jgi:hypothetical protein
MAKKTKEVILGYFEDPHDLLEIGAKAHRMGYQNLDAYTPYPVHGLEHALGLKKSWVPAAAKTALVIGAILGYYFQYWVSAFGFELNVGGKPMNSWPAFVPVIFESAVFFAGVTTLFSVFFSAKLKPFGNKFIDRRFTDDKLALVMPVEHENEDDIINFLKGAGSYEIIKVEL